jgi:vacuolar-type H+-ATPase subunit D/Vma8
VLLYRKELACAQERLEFTQQEQASMQNRLSEVTQRADDLSNKLAASMETAMESATPHAVRMQLGKALEAFESQAHKLTEKVNQQVACLVWTALQFWSAVLEQCCRPEINALHMLLQLKPSWSLLAIDRQR